LIEDNFPYSLNLRKKASKFKNTKTIKSNKSHQNSIAMSLEYKNSIKSSNNDKISNFRPIDKIFNDKENYFSIKKRHENVNKINNNFDIKNNPDINNTYTNNEIRSMIKSKKNIRKTNQITKIKHKRSSDKLQKIDINNFNKNILMNSEKKQQV